VTSQQSKREGTLSDSSVLRQPPHKRSRSGTLPRTDDEGPLPPHHHLQQSHLYLRPEPQQREGGDEDGTEPVRLWLPHHGSDLKVDEHLSRIPRIVSRAEELLDAPAAEEKKNAASGGSGANPFLENTPHYRCLNVLQGEVAHVSSEQADIVVSAEATTCHVIALRSTCRSSSSSSSTTSPPFCSVAHMDRAYTACVEEMVREHLAHHDEYHAGARSAPEQMNAIFMEDQESSSSSTRRHHNRKPSFLPDLSLDEDDESVDLAKDNTPPRIEMELHIIGGYLDSNGLSQMLSNQIVARFDELAHKYKDRIRIFLSTAAISSLNNCSTSSNKPKSRGLGIVTKTGQVFSLKSSLPSHLLGPALPVRAARSFATSQSDPTLAVIHDRTCRQGEIRIRPFGYQQRRDLNVLLHVPDKVLLSVASTSPEHESEEFCTNFRRTLSFVNSVSAESVFGQGQDQKPLVYVRSAGDLNTWEPHGDSASEGSLPYF
jgi:hypothetical protein